MKSTFLKFIALTSAGLAFAASCSHGGSSSNPSSGGDTGGGSQGGGSASGSQGGGSASGSGSGSASGSGSGSASGSGSGSASGSGSGSASGSGSGSGSASWNGVPGWPDYVAMGAVVEPEYLNSKPGLFDDKPLDALFKYAGNNGNGDPGVIDPPSLAYQMTTNLNYTSKFNSHPTRAVMVEYTANLSNDTSNFSDFTNASSSSASGPSYIMARHFASLIGDTTLLADNPVTYAGNSYYGSLIMNPDLLGTIEQQGLINEINVKFKDNNITTAVKQALCLMTTQQTYDNNFDPNAPEPTKPYIKSYTGVPVKILEQMLKDGYPTWSLSGATQDPFWNTAQNGDTKINAWFNACISNSTYDTTKYNVPTFTQNLDGWIHANNWLIRAFAPKGTVTFAWQENMWANTSGFWLHGSSLSMDQIKLQYSDPVSKWLQSNAPSAMNDGANSPDYFVFDRYERDDSEAPDLATLYNSQSWDNYLNAVGLISKQFNNIPIMLWQIPGSHIPYTSEASPELATAPNTGATIPGNYIFSTAGDYFFGDDALNSDLSNMILGTGTSINSLVGAYSMPSNYNFTTHGNYSNYLKANGYNWKTDNKKLNLAAQNNVFAILWGGGSTTSVIPHTCTTNDNSKKYECLNENGWLAKKIVNYYKNPTSLSQKKISR